MTNPQPTLRINVDLTNPGQFFACCGLLELASRLDIEATGWFDDGTFILSGAIEKLLTKFRNARFKQIALTNDELKSRNGKVPKNNKTVEPIEIMLDDGIPLLLDWWLLPHKHHGLKLWSGSNSLGSLVEDVFNAIRQDDSKTILAKTIQLPRQPFFYAASRSLHERDFGVSMDKIGREFEHFPYVELLTIIGLQRFRPALITTRRFRYCSWATPIPASLAGAVAGGTISTLIDECFVFPLIDRDDNGHKQFTRSERRPHV